MSLNAIEYEKQDKINVRLTLLRPPGGGSVIEITPLFNKAVLLLQTFILDHHKPMALYPTGPLKFPLLVK